MSARQISIAAEAPVSSIYHHFGSLEHLFTSSQQAALALAKDWCDRQLQQLSGFTGPPSALAPFFAHIVDEWAHEQRQLAFAWRECQLLAEDNALFREQSEQWNHLWAQFWIEVGERFSLGRGRIVAERVFENESLLHMIRWRRAIDRAGLDESARALAAWLDGSPVPEAPWREFARAEALRSMPAIPERDETAARIVAAATELIGTSGVPSLTHRAVAERAGLTLGTVSHKFRTKSALIEAAFEGIYRAMLEQIRPDRTLPTATSLNAVIDGIAHMIARSTRERGRDELFVATAREAELSQFGSQLRYLRGRTSKGTLQSIIGSHRTVTSVEAALFSGFLTSQIRIFAGLTPDVVATRIREELQVLLNLLDVQRKIA